MNRARERVQQLCEGVCPVGVRDEREVVEQVSNNGEAAVEFPGRWLRRHLHGPHVIWELEVALRFGVVALGLHEAAGRGEKRRMHNTNEHR